MNILVTNNPLCKEQLGHTYIVQFAEESPLATLRRVRDFVHLGHFLITHPTAGGLPSGTSPYKSVVVSAKACLPKPSDINSIEHTIASYEKSGLPTPKEHLDDFMMLDLALVKGRN